MKIYSKSSKEIETDCMNWAEEIKKDYTPDLIVFVAKSGFLFARPIAYFFGCEMVDIIAKRPANEIKNKLEPLIRKVPKRIILKILSSPIMYSFNENKKNRVIMETPRYQHAKKGSFSHVLIVDDSADTGWTLKMVRDKICDDYPNTSIRIACYSVIDNSKKRIYVDYFRYQNAVILTATSRKSKEYQDFLKQYNDWSRWSGAVISDEN